MYTYYKGFKLCNFNFESIPFIINKKNDEYFESKNIFGRKTNMGSNILCCKLRPGKGLQIQVQRSGHETSL